MKEGDKIVVLKGSQRGRTGVVTSTGGRVGGEPAAQVLLYGKRHHTLTFFAQSELAILADTQGGK